ncbi:ATP/GTP-binding protein [Streptomyces sp. NPDC006864]|uniref:ATP/GTP-binding protein n=1 Tax=Streptomyces sp. NPDC006864 TaxID=3154780 RepID=UPI00345681E4
MAPGPPGPAAAPVTDPEAVARRAAALMKLTGPDVTSPRAAGKCVVGIPMWMRANPSPSPFGPASASATVGSVTVTATAKVSQVVWAMGDGPTVTWYGPGTPCTPDQGQSMSPDCGHRHQCAAFDEPDGHYRGTATATWTIAWTAPAPALGDEGGFPGPPAGRHGSGSSGPRHQLTRAR